MSDFRKLSDEYYEICKRVIQEEDELIDLRSSNATFVCLTSQHKKTSQGGYVYAQCEKVADKYKWAIPADYTITIFEPNVEDFSDEQKYILMYHELMHIDIGMTDSGDEIYRIKPHDLMDFKNIIDRYGVDWNEVQ